MLSYCARMEAIRSAIMNRGKLLRSVLDGAVVQANMESSVRLPMEWVARWRIVLEE